MDSREYIFIYPINSAADIPEDLRACVKDRSFDRGVFLPQDDTNWFTRPPRYPARLLLLDGRWLHIIPHPNSGQCITELHLEDLVQLEAGTILLLGWIDLTTRISTEHLIYNTRGSRPLESLLATARRRWLGEPSETDSVEPRSFGHQLDINFTNLLHDSLDPDEAVLSQCFASPIRYQRNFVLFRRNRWRSGHLIAVTSGNRILWLKDEYQGRRERYAAVIVSAPTSLCRHCTIGRMSGHYELVITFVSGLSWRISMYDASIDCAGFSQDLNERFARQRTV